MRVSAPGKLLLFGDHAVVYGYPSISTAVGMRLEVEITQTEDPGIHLQTPGNGNQAFITEVVSQAKKNWHLPKGISLTTKSSFSGKYGFGSSSAVTVASLKALAEMCDISLTKKELFDHAYEVILRVQGVGSGVDAASSCFGKTIFYKNRGEIIEELQGPVYSFIIGYSGEKADTVKIVKEVAEKKKMYPEKTEKLFQAIGTLVEQAKIKMEDGDVEAVGKYMDFNQEYLRDLGVSSEKLETLISAAKKTGALGAKLSGAGGGDCMIALIKEEKREAVSRAIETAGGEVVTVGMNAEGVRIETTDDQQECFVVVDTQDNILDYRSRYDCHHNPSLIHRGVSVIIVDPHGRILLQKRSKTKDTRPGYWSTSVGGHVMKNESYEEAAYREMKEELGISPPLTLIGKNIHKYSDETEMNMLFITQYAGSFNPNVDEIEEVRFFNKDELLRNINTSSFKLSEAARYDLQQGGFI